MKTLRYIAFIVLILMTAVITFFTCNLICSLISNYASLSRTSLSCLPMLFFSLELISLMFAIFNYIVLKRRDSYFYKLYSMNVGVLAVLGVVFSILTGTLVYGSFVKDYIFRAYPLLMLIIHLALLGLSIYVYVPAYIDIKKNNPQRVVYYKNRKLFFLRETALGMILVYALEKLGAFVLIPVFYSDVDSALVIPFFIQLLIPTLIFVTFLIHEHWLHNRKVTRILSTIAFSYTVVSLIYMIAISHGNYPLTINPLSPIQQFERLLKLPVDMIMLYGLCLLISGLNLYNNIVMAIKEKKKKAIQAK